MEKAEAEIMTAFGAGVNYYDTAYVYPGSEAALGEILEKNGIRKQVKIATKLPHYLIQNSDSMERYFSEQLRRLRTDYVDYYLMHMLTDTETWERLIALGILEWLEDKKASGAIRQIGFSYHGNTDMFCRLIDAYDWDFCQIQYNYMDEHSQAGRRGLHYANAKGLPVIIMEPLRGGRLVNRLPEQALKIFENYPIKRTPVQWALRWLWNQPEVTCVLSGMNSVEMVSDNVNTASDVTVGELGPREEEMLQDVVKAINSKMKVGCTGCGYCMPCPKNVDIPGTFAAYNRNYSDGHWRALVEYFMCTAMRRTSSAASNCVECGKCERHCPQHIPIRRELKNARRKLEGPLYKIGKRIVKWMKAYCLLLFIIGLAAAGMSGCKSTSAPADYIPPQTEPVTQTQNHALMWDACTPVSGSPGLYELHADFLENSNYTDCAEFAGNLLLIGQAYADAAYETGDSLGEETGPDTSPWEGTEWEGDDFPYEEVSPTFYFALYDPQENSVVATLNTEEQDISYYRIVGDQLLLLDYDTQSIYCYDDHLSLCGSCSGSELGEALSFMFYPSDSKNCFWDYSYSENALIRFSVSDGSYTIEPVSLDMYGVCLIGTTPDRSRLMVQAIDKDTLTPRIFLLDASTLEKTFLPEDLYYFYGSLTDQHYLAETDTFHGIWMYGDFDQKEASYFVLPISAHAQILYDNTFLVYEEQVLAEDDLHTIETTIYDGSGNALNYFYYDCGALSGEDSFYPAPAWACLENYGCCIQIMCDYNSHAYLLVWDLTTTSGTASSLPLYATEELAEAAAQLEEPTETVFDDSIVTLIEDPDNYDWGDLTEVHQYADRLARQYGLSIYLGPEPPDQIESYDVAQCLDPEQIETALDCLSEILSCYPDHFFSQLVYNGLKGIRIYLTSDLASQEEDLLDSAGGFVANINDYVVMALNVDYYYDWNYMVNHEISHMIDRRLAFLESVNPDALFSEDTWCSYNPSDFDYLYTYADYWDNEFYMVYSEYFLDAYGMTYPTEDRAELFGAAMDYYMKSDKSDYYYVWTTPMTDKLRYYCDAIRDGFNTTGWPEVLPWEYILE